MKCLVTGAAGFIGSHLVDLLIKEGHTVVGLDDLSTGNRRNLDGHEGNPGFKFYRGDINRYHFEKLFPFDWIFHLAGKADLIPSIKDPGLYHEVNVNGTLNMLQLSRLFPPKKFIYAASSTCYGIPKEYPTPETAELKPKHPYGLTKMIGEQYVLHWGEVYKIPVLSLRLFNVYGPRARTSGSYGAMFGVFLAQLANDKPLTVVGDGTQKRDFTHVRDVAAAFLTGAQSKYTNQAFNVGSSDFRSVNDIVKMLKAPQVEYLPKRPGEPDITWADTSAFRFATGWKPKVRLEEGVAQMKDNLKDWQTAPIWTKGLIARETVDWFKYL